MRIAPGIATGASYAFALGSVIYLLAEAIAAAGYPGYSYFTQVISVLGVYPGMFVHGHVSPSKLALVMNIGFFLTGALFVIGHLGAMRQQLRRHWANAVSLMAVLFAAGISLVGAVQGGQPTEGGWHSLGAALAIFGGNTALVLTGLGLKTADARWFRIGCVTLGLLGILSAFGLLVIFETPYPDLGATAERLSVYTIIAGSIWASFFLVGARARPRSQGLQLLIASSAAAELRPVVADVADVLALEWRHQSPHSGSSSSSAINCQRAAARRDRQQPLLLEVVQVPESRGMPTSKPGSRGSQLGTAKFVFRRQAGLRTPWNLKV